MEPRAISSDFCDARRVGHWTNGSHCFSNLFLYFCRALIIYFLPMYQNTSSLPTSGRSGTNFDATTIWISSLLSLFSCTTIFGNTMVVYTVYVRSSLHTPTGYFIASLAVADLIVGLMVMPLNIILHISQDVWYFGLAFCDIFHSMDVLASTASIWNLCVISIDRYLAIRDPWTYRDIVSHKRVRLAVFCVWVGSSVIAFPAIVWWRWHSPMLYQDPSYCGFTDNLAYIIFSSVISFYFPLGIILFAYRHIFAIANKNEKKIMSGRIAIKCDKVTEASKTSAKATTVVGKRPSMYLRVHRGGTRPEGSSANRRHTSADATQAETQILIKKSHNDMSKGTSLKRGPTKLSIIHDDSQNDMSQAISLKRGVSRLSMMDPGTMNDPVKPQTPIKSLASTVKRKFTNASVDTVKSSKILARFLKEKRAAKTLGIVVGCFLVCWLPFFVVNILLVICPNCATDSSTIYSVVTWLGHCNSMLNPLIYPCFNREFRRSIYSILCARSKRKKEALLASRNWARAGLANAIGAAFFVPVSQANPSVGKRFSINLASKLNNQSSKVASGSPTSNPSASLDQPIGDTTPEAVSNFEQFVHNFDMSGETNCYKGTDFIISNTNACQMDCYVVEHHV